MYIAKLNERNDAIVFSDDSSMYSKYIEGALWIEAVPDGIGVLRCDGERVWREPVLEPTPEPEPPKDPIVELQEANKLKDAQIQAMTERSDFVEECLAEMATLLYK